jgi:folate-binding protein YgfZ
VTNLFAGNDFGHTPSHCVILKSIIVIPSKSRKTVLSFPPSYKQFPMNIPDTLDALHEVAEVEFDAHDRLHLPLRYAKGMEAETLQLQERCGLLDRKAWLLLELDGPEAVKFLQGMVTADVASIPVGQMRHGVICQSKGKIQHVLDIWRLTPERILLSCGLSEGLQVGNHLHKFHIREEFVMRLVTPSLSRLDVRGPASETVLHSLGYTGESPWMWAATEIQVTRLSKPGAPHFAVLVPGEQAAPWAQAMLEHADCAWTGWLAWQQQDTLEGRPVFGRDFTTDHFVQEAALGDHISFAKGCYIGQEPNARLFNRGRPQRQLVGVRVPSQADLDAGHTLFLGDTSIGYVTSLSQQTKDGQRLGLAMVKSRVLEEEAPALALSVSAPADVMWFRLPTHIQR